jgi:deoxyhypusine synthase
LDKLENEATGAVIEKEVVESSKKIFKEFSIDKFALIHYKTNKIRSIFLLNIFVEMDILIGEKEIILNKILEKRNLKSEDFLKILEENLGKEENTVLKYLMKNV